MKRIIAVSIMIAILFVFCGCANEKDIPKFVIEDVKNYIGNEYDVDIIDYYLINSEDEIYKYGIGSPYGDDLYFYQFKTSDFDFLAYSKTSPGAISYKSQDVITNISAVIYYKNIDAIKRIAQKYNIKVENNLNQESLSLDNKLVLDFSNQSKESLQKFSEEMVEISDIKKLIDLKYEKIEKEDGTISFSTSGYDEHIIQDYSSVNGYYDTQCYSCNSLLIVLAREYYK